MFLKNSYNYGWCGKAVLIPVLENLHMLKKFIPDNDNDIANMFSKKAKQNDLSIIYLRKKQNYGSIIKVIFIVQNMYSYQIIKPKISIS